MPRLLHLVSLVVSAYAAAQASFVPYTAETVERMRAEGKSERDIAAALMPSRPCPAYMESGPQSPLGLHPHARPPLDMRLSGSSSRDRSGDVAPAPRDYASPYDYGFHRSSSYSRKHHAHALDDDDEYENDDYTIQLHSSPALSSGVANSLLSGLWTRGSSILRVLAASPDDSSPSSISVAAAEDSALKVKKRSLSTDTQLQERKTSGGEAGMSLRQRIAKFIAMYLASREGMAKSAQLVQGREQALGNSMENVARRERKMVKKRRSGVVKMRWNGGPRVRK